MSSPFARATATVPVPFDPPHEVTVQQLNGRQLAKAQTAFLNDLIAQVQVRGGAKVQKDIETLFKTDTKDVSEEAKQIQAEVEKMKADPLNGFDKYSLCYAGIKSWTYPESLALVPVVEHMADGREITVMRVLAIDDLNDEAVTFFATEVLRLTKPALFQTTDEQETARKNG